MSQALTRISHKVLGINASNGLPGGCSQEKSNEGLATLSQIGFFREQSAGSAFQGFRPKVCEKCGLTQSSAPTHGQARERLFFVDLIRLLSMLAIMNFHLHEATFYINYHEGHPSHSLLEWPFVHYARFFAFSGFSILIISYFLMGWIGLSKEKIKKLILVSGVGTLLLFLVFYEANGSQLEWDIYPFIAISTLVVASLAPFPKTLLACSLLAFALLALPPDWWVFPELHHHFFYNALFGDFRTPGGGSWPLIPWLGLPLISFALGQWLHQHQLWQKRLHHLSWREGGLWIMALALCSSFWGSFYSTPAGSEFYQFVQSQARLDLLAHLMIVFFCIRLGWVRPVNRWAQATKGVAWISKLFVNQKFFLFYLVNWGLIGLFSLGEETYYSYPLLFDLVLFGLWPLTEIICYGIIRIRKQIDGVLELHQRNAL